MRKTATITAGLLLGASLLAGCGSDDGDGDKKASSGGDYCDTLKSMAADIKPFTAEGSTPDFEKFEEFLDDARDLAGDAPSEVSAAWDTMLEGMDKLVDALAEAGIKIEDLGKIAAGEMPEGVDMAKLQELGTELEKLGSEEMNKAGETITKHAKDECGVDLDSVS